MQEVIMTGLVVLVFVSGVLGAYWFGVSNGTHRERMKLIDIINNIPTIVTTREHVWYCVNYIVNKMREE
jgi:hypothetical protein